MPRRMYNRLGEFSMGDPKIEKALHDFCIPVDEGPLETMARVGEVERVIVYWRDKADEAATVVELASIDSIEAVNSYLNNFGVIKAGVSKGAALRSLWGHLSIPVEESHGFGDSLNDIGMIDDADTSYAVANATPEIKAVANVVLEWGNGHDAVAHAVMELLGK